MNSTDKLLQFLTSFDVVNLVKEHYKKFDNEAPGKLLEAAIEEVQQQWPERIEKKKVPDPSNDEAMKALHDYIGVWKQTYNITGMNEFYYLSLFLAGRLNVQVSLENILKLKGNQDENAI